MRPKRHESLCETSEATWRHLNFFQHKACLTARVPQISSPECGLLKLQSVSLCSWPGQWRSRRSPR
ncbi:transposase, degenerate [Chlorobaculum tepidum TLS]|uniref:Transposase, degenerate n=1 Tax=Chlorobaculum tepidum (strain ATCC 49652 / DSM 12025 / NBRC 103806 / TLS) TaxID=194439 RepID=Q4W555_CHLTE|nr:transposase, degenerate [Chlorobaculum tepidum TLS]